MTESFRRVLAQWNRVLARWDAELQTKLSQDDLSALYASLPDCFASFTRIYDDLLPALEQTPTADHGQAHDRVHDIGSAAGELQHIKAHIAAAERGFAVLLKFLGERA